MNNTWTDAELAEHDREKEADERQWLKEADATVGMALKALHNPETCKDPGCDCMPF